MVVTAATAVATKYVDVHALRNVVVVALVAGIGLTALFAFGARSLSMIRPGGVTVTDRVVAAACFVVAAVAVAVGVWAVLAK